MAYSLLLPFGSVMSRREERKHLEPGDKCTFEAAHIWILMKHGWWRRMGVWGSC